jgi:hypothetical protein
VEVWTYGDELFELNSMYALPDDAWSYELTALSGVRGPGLAVLIPDATPDHAPFTPSGAAHVQVLMTDGSWPWSILLRFLHHVEASGDIVTDEAAAVTGDLTLSRNTWTFRSRRFEVNSFGLDDPDCWSYELYEVGQPADENHYLDVRIPNIQPDPNRGTFSPDHTGAVTVTVFGEWALPWPVITHFLTAVDASGDIVRRPDQP